MITLTKSGETIVFTFEDSQHYLYGDGTIQVPLNSLILIEDSSDMVTFRKLNGDIFVSALVSEFGMTKSELEQWYKDNMVGSTGGGSGSGVTSGEVQTMIDESISGLAESSAVTLEIAEATSGKVDSDSLATVATSGSYDDLLDKPTIPTVSSAITSGDTNAVAGGAVYDKFDEVEQTTARVLNDLNSRFSGKADTSAVTAVQDSLSGYVTLDTVQVITERKTFQNSDKAIELKQVNDNSKVGFKIKNSASTNNELASFELRPDTYTDSSSVQHPLLYFGHYRNSSIANAGVPQTMVGFRQYDQSNSAAYHYLMPLPSEAKTPFSLTTTFKDYFAPMGFKVDSGGTMVTTDNTGVVDLSSYIGGGTGGGNPTVELTQAEYDALVSAGTVSADTYYIITDAPAVTAMTSGDVESMITEATSGKADTSAVTAAISAATSGFVATSAITSAVTSASTDSEIPTAKAVFDAIPTGGTGASYSAGTSIDITNDVISVKEVSGNTTWVDLTSSIPTETSMTFNASSVIVTLYEGSVALGVSIYDNNGRFLSIENNGSGLDVVGNTQYFDYTTSGFTITASPLSSSDKFISLVNENENNLDDAVEYFSAYTNSSLTLQEFADDVYTQFGGLKLVKLTQNEYDALVSGGTVDNNTLYVVV